MRLKDQIALVTGGGRGIGRAIVQAFAAEGAKVAVVYRGSKEAADALAQEVTQAGGAAKAYQCDVADAAAVKACAEQAQKDLGPITILVNSAGVIADGLFVRMEAEEWHKVLNTNLGGVFNFCHELAFPMMQKRAGRIINISSVAATHVNPGQANYAASKAGLIGLARSIARELGSRSITANVIAPGFVDTDMTAELSDARKDEIRASIPLRRYGSVDEIAGAALYLASDAAAYVSGVVLAVDGGLGMGI